MNDCPHDYRTQQRFPPEHGSAVERLVSFHDEFIGPDHYFWLAYGYCFKSVKVETSR